MIAWAMNQTRCLLIEVLRRPELVTTLGATEWDLLVRQARRTDLLAALCATLDERALLSQIPAKPRDHLESARTIANRHGSAVGVEVERIRRALDDAGVPLILLKGAAYVAAGLPSARGRLFFDIDILVPKDSLDEVELVLLGHGWVATHLDAYDQRYYRQWMHELPPLRHARRQTVLDVHHAIVPETARLRPDPHKLLEAVVPLDDQGGLRVLAPVDMVLHSTTHLFQDGEFEHGLRDLVDLDGLLRHFGREAGFWPELTARAAELDLTRPLYYALRYTQCILGTPIPEPVRQAARSGRPRGLMPALMDALFARALAPDHPSCDRPSTGLARWLLYVRAHYLRMPLHLLLPHLLRKATRRRQAGLA